ncbi:alpha/beta fold hydrolase [Filimonas effusa]|uniref:Alpha/beta hydrolase n=1 Tax=Filimonas effusa TaxID=2508721 RepID=A0A4Q1D260_9BACT|nr:alpha/beta hydrolase [Filimonas effusa]RXK81400.1 alpha/beta hydrolase [Filimonas effusa]
MLYSFNYNDTLISYRKTGKGTPVIFLHGFGEDSTIWNRQIAYLEPDYLVITPDFPGSGNSQALPGTPGIEEFARVIDALLQHEQLEKAVLFGHSMGGYITLAFAALFPDKLTGFGLVHSSAFADSPEKKQNRQRGIEMIEQYGGPSFLRTTIPNLFAAAFKSSHPEQVNELIEQSAAFADLPLQQYYKAMMERPDRTAVLSGSKTPVLFIIGTDDVAAPLNDVLQQVSLPNCSYIHILENVGHMGMWEATAAVNSHLLHFLEALNRRE